MSEQKNSEYFNINKNSKYQKILQPTTNDFITRKSFNLIKTKSPLNLKQNKNSKFKLTKYKIKSDDLNISQHIISNSANSKINQFIKNSQSQKLINNTLQIKSTKKNFLDNIDINDINTEKFLLLKINEVNKTLEENENIFRYNQKILKKKLEEKENQINNLRSELVKEKIRKQNLFQNEYNENKNNLLDEIKQLQKQVNKLSNMNSELSLQNSEYEKIIKNLENKNKENILKIKQMNKNLYSLIQEKTIDILENEIKQYINDLNIQIESSLNELNSLNEEMSSIKEENKKLKMLSREIIEARSDTELFFIDVLNDAKKDLYKQKKEKIRGFSFFPKLKNFYDKGDEIKVDIRELTPEMREKMLRNLFEKINRSHNENNFLELNYMINGDIDNIEN
jgi:hypothetical protein